MEQNVLKISENTTSLQNQFQEITRKMVEMSEKVEKVGIPTNSTNSTNSTKTTNPGGKLGK